MRCIVIRGDAWLVLLSPCNTSLSAGQAIPSDLDDAAAYLRGAPNEHQWLATMVLDIARTADYLASNCVTQTMKQPRSWEYGYWLLNNERDLVDEESTMEQCVDNFGAWDAFERYCPCCPTTTKRHFLQPGFD